MTDDSIMATDLIKSVVITGCDVANSYGYELALCLDKQGFGVFAGCADCNSIGARSLASRGSTRLAILQIDVTKQEEIDDAAEMIRDLVGDDGIWALINCAESYAVAEVDWFSNGDYERLMNINFFGTVRVIKALLPLLRKTKGRIVNLSNLAGCISRCGMSAFSSSKFALEAFSDSLRQEMLKWGIFVSVIQPSFIPESKDILMDAETSVKLNRVPKELKDLYGDDYFVNYIRSVSGSAKGAPKKKYLTSSNPGTSFANSSPIRSSMTSSPSSSKRENPSSSVDHQKNTSKSASTSKRELKLAFLKPVDTPTLTPTLKVQGSANLINMNRVLHALVDAVTSSSPKVRYFVGSFRDYVVKTVSPVLPTVILDTYFMSGEVANVVPKKLKEKQD